AGKQARLGEDLEAIADADDRTAVGGELADGLHDRAEPGDGARSQVVAVGEAAGHDDGVDAVDRAVAVPEQPGVGAEVAHDLEHVELAVRPGEQHDPDRGHAGTTSANVTVASSMTGFVRKRSHSASTSARAACSSGASMAKRMSLPTRTPLTPSKSS